MRFILLLLLSGYLIANDFSFDKEKGRSIPNFVGELKLFRGKVFKLTDGKQAPVQVGTRFFKNESIVTHDKSFAKLTMVDDTVVALGPNSELNFSHYKFLDKTDRQIIYTFIKGQLSAHVKNKAKDGDIQIKTSMAVMGIRGTRVLVNHQTIQEKEISEFSLLNGMAQVTDNKNIVHELKEADRHTFVLDSIKKESAMEKGQLTKEEFEYLKAENIKEETDFRPFLPYFDPSKIAQNSSIYPLFHKIETQGHAPQNSPSGQDNKPNEDAPWKKNLKELNDRLKKNGHKD